MYPTFEETPCKYLAGWEGPDESFSQSFPTRQEAFSWLVTELSWLAIDDPVTEDADDAFRAAKHVADNLGSSTLSLRVGPNVWFARRAT